MSDLSTWPAASPSVTDDDTTGGGGGPIQTDKWQGRDRTPDSVLDDSFTGEDYEDHAGFRGGGEFEVRSPLSSPQCRTCNFNHGDVGKWMARLS
jgi:hypothetical protein